MSSYDDFFSASMTGSTMCDAVVTRYCATAKLISGTIAFDVTSDDSLGDAVKVVDEIENMTSFVKWEGGTEAIQALRDDYKKEKLKTFLGE